MHFYDELQNDVVNDAMEIINEEDVNGVFADVTDNTERSREYRLKLINEIKNGEHKELVKGLLEKIIGRHYATDATNRKNIIKWLECSPSKMPYVLLKKSKLQQLYREKINQTIPAELTTTSMLIDVLSGEQPPPSDANAAKKIIHPIEAVMHANYLPPLKGTSLELCKIGHKMEGIYGKQLLQISDDNNGIRFQNGKYLKILHMFRAGLVGRSNREYQKDSPDFVAYGILDNMHIVLIIEIKARCSSSTAAKERRKNNMLRNCAYLSCYSNDLRKHVLKKSEAVQVRNF